MSSNEQLFKSRLTGKVAAGNGVLRPDEFTHTMQAALRQAAVSRIRVGLLGVALAMSLPSSANSLFPAEYELSSLASGDGSTGFVINGVRSSDKSGYTVSAAGDVNGDGLDDLAIGAPHARPGGRFEAGESYVVFGRDSGFTAEFGLSGLASGGGSEGFVITGIEEDDRSGTSVSAAGDINGDGVDDLLIAAPGSGTSSIGESYVVFGRDTGFPAEIELANLASGDGSTGFVLNGAGTNTVTRQSVSSAGDVNGDGLDDLIVGTWGASPGGRNRAGASYVVYGRDTGFSSEISLSSLALGDGSTGFVINGASPNDFSGQSVSSAGDINSDGKDDLIIGAYYASPGGRNIAGKTYVVFGRDTGFAAEFELSNLESGDGSAGFVLNGSVAGDQSGTAVSAAGDINGDGKDDLIVGANYAGAGGTFAGESYLIFGRDTGFPAEVELSDLALGDGSTGVVFLGVSVAGFGGSLSGSSVSAVGDVNGDGLDDLIIGAPFASPGERTLAGEAHVVFGRDTSFPAATELSQLALGDGSEGFVLNGIVGQDNAGQMVSAAGDINGDGVGDIVIGAPKANALFNDDGQSYVVFGRAPDSDDDGVHDLVDNCTLVANTDQRDSNGDGYGNICDPDLDNDGVVNFIDIALWTPRFLEQNAEDQDFNGDGLVNFSDFALFSQYFLQVPGPGAVSD